MEGTGDEQRKNMVDKEENLAVGGSQSASCSADTSGLAVAGASSNSESQPKMFKLNIDCFDHLFEWLTRTSTHMQTNESRRRCLH